MRFLRLDFGDDLHSLDLHPLVTVVSGLSPQHQRHLFESVRRFSTGSTAGVRGLIEHDGELVELDGRSKDSLDSLNTTSDVVVYVDGAADSANRLVGLQAEIDQWQRRTAIADVVVEEIRADLDPSLKAKVVELRRLVDPMGVETNDLSEASTQQVRYAAARNAYERVQATERYMRKVDPVVADLIEQWDRYQTLRRDNEEHLANLEGEVERAKQAVEQARAKKAHAESEAKPVLLTTQEEARLEALSELDSEGGKGWRRKGLTDEEQAEMQALLDKVGVNSWTEYWVFRTAPTASAERRATVAEATKELELAIERQQRVEQLAASDQVYLELDVSLNRIRKESKEYLGAVVPKDLGAALKGLIDEVESPEWLAALNDLRDVLASNDLRPPYGYEPDEILGWTASWLEAEARLQESGDEDSNRGAEELESLKQELARAEEHLLRHRRALIRIERAEKSARAASERLERLQLQMAERQTRTAPSTADDVIAFIRPVLDRVSLDAGESIPVVVTGSMPDLDAREMQILMSELEKTAENVQIIVVTNRTEAISWAGEVGLRRAVLCNGVSGGV
ncbi:MAG: hypothetical protein OES24_06215 [Acidimicrobiia bacterium]|nr:hypothetical protein [Acidimicrobiia bacterium]